MKLRGRNSMLGGQMTIEIKYILFRPQSFMMVVANGRWNRFHHRSFSIRKVRRIFKKKIFFERNISNEISKNNEGILCAHQYRIKETKKLIT